MTVKSFTSLISGVAFVGVTLMSALPASAEQAPDKNGPGVARVSILQGSAVVQRGDSNQQVAAVVNAPLLPGDYISTGATTRAEVQFDGGSAVRLGGNVQARITDNDPNNRRMQLADGTIVVGLVHQSGPFQVDTPSVSVRAQTAGDYRISIGKDGSTWVTARRGTADVVSPQQTYTLESGRTLVARGSASNPTIAYTSEVGYDSFDDFNAKRDQTMVAALNANSNLNPGIAGYDNLDQYGQWQDVAGYGQVWVPNEPSGWAPYRNGNWTWEGGYGWTWVGSEPWGWAPYHYGNWIYANGVGWGWYPPAYSASPAWSPALVGFFGFGAGVGVGVSVGFGFPWLGWYPVAPFAPFYPWWPGWGWTGFGWGFGGGFGFGGFGCCGFGGFGTRIVNVTNITNINFRHGATGTLVGNWHHGTISGHTIAVDPSKFGGHIGTIHGAVPVSPTRDNLNFGGRRIGAPVTMSKAFNSPRFASDRSISARSSFEQQQRTVSQAIHGNPGRDNAPVSRGNAMNSRDNTTNARDNAPVSRGNAMNSRDNTTNARDNAPVSRGNAMNSRDNTTNARDNAPVSRGNAMNTRDNAPTGSWQRFDQARGVGGRDNSIASHPQRSDAAGSTARDNSGFGRSSDTGRNFGGETSRAQRAPSDSWSRFSQERGNVSSGDRGTYSSSGRGSYSSSGRGSYSSGDRGSYSRSGSYGSSYSRGSSERNPYSSYSRGSSGSYPSYSRGSSGSYPSYSRGSGGSYPSYSRGSGGSYPSYSRGSGGSYPSYSRGSGGSYPSYSRGGGASAPHSSGGGGGGGGGSRGGGGGRPPR
jgi:hypothetical protein